MLKLTSDRKLIKGKNVYFQQPVPQLLVSATGCSKICDRQINLLHLESKWEMYRRKNYYNTHFHLKLILQE
jgi:hypothetical protein